MSVWSRSALSATATSGEKYSIVASLSSISETIGFPAAQYPCIAKPLGIAPTRYPQSRESLFIACARSALTVLLPWLPTTAVSFRGAHNSAQHSPRRATPLAPQNSANSPRLRHRAVLITTLSYLPDGGRNFTPRFSRRPRSSGLGESSKPSTELPSSARNAASGAIPMPHTPPI